MQQYLRSIRFPIIILISATIFLTSGCTSLRFPGVYRIAVLQGNIIDQKKVNQLKPGMTKTQVQFLMGTPLVNDMFNRDRWDYVYHVQRGGKQLRDLRFTLYFTDDKLVSWEGDFKPKDTADEDEEEYLLEDAKKIKSK